jgi:catechol 2,3-dioxygenase
MPGLPPDTRIASVTLAVADLNRSLSFYRDLLGASVHEAGQGWAALGTTAGAPWLYLHEQPEAIPRPRRTSGLFHVALLVPTRAALGQVLYRLASSGWPVDGAADHLVSEAMYLRDPDGLGLEIYRDRARAEWQWQGSEVQMATDPLDIDGVLSSPGADASWSGLPEGTAVGHVHLQVPDLATAEHFYCDVIGFTPMLRGYAGALFVAAGGYHHHVGLNVWAGIGAPPPPGAAVGLRQVELEASVPNDAEHHDVTTGLTVIVRPPRRAGTDVATHGP